MRVEEYGKEPFPSTSQILSMFFLCDDFYYLFCLANRNIENRKILNESSIFIASLFWLQKLLQITMVSSSEISFSKETVIIIITYFLYYAMQNLKKFLSLHFNALKKFFFGGDFLLSKNKEKEQRRISGGTQ